MTFNWKFLSGCAGGAFLLSFLTGLIGKVGFGTAFLRAFVWGVIFGALAFGVDYVLRNFFPELFSGASKTPSEEGSSVDITLEGENPHASRSGELGESGVAEQSSGDAVESDEAYDSAGGGVAEGDSRPEPVETLEEFDASDASDVEELAAASDSGDGNPDGELPSFGTVEATFAAGERGIAEVGPAKGSVDALAGEEDPEVIARAVRTLMNKDQEG